MPSVGNVTSVTLQQFDILRRTEPTCTANKSSNQKISKGEPIKSCTKKWSIYTHTYINLFYWYFCIKTLVSHWVHLGSAVENENKAPSAHSDSRCRHLRCFKRENNDSTSMAPLNLLKTACESCEGWRCNLFPRKPYFRLLETALPHF